MRDNLGGIALADDYRALMALGRNVEMDNHEVIKRHMEDLRVARYRSSTQRETMLARFADFLGTTPLLDADPAQIKAFIDGPPDRKPASVSTYRSHLAAFYSWCVRENLMLASPADRVPKTRVHPGLPRPVPQSTLEAALTHASVKTRMMLLLAMFGGLRCCEIAPIRGEHVRHGVEPQLWIPEQKGGNEATIYLHPRVMERIDDMPKRGFWFPDGKNAEAHLSANTVSARCNRFLHDHGVDGTMHQLRHTFGTSVYEKTGDIGLAQRMLRHSNLSSTQIYARISDRRVAAAMAALTLSD